MTWRGTCHLSSHDRHSEDEHCHPNKHRSELPTFVMHVLVYVSMWSPHENVLHTWWCNQERQQRKESYLLFPIMGRASLPIFTTVVRRGQAFCPVVYVSIWLAAGCVQAVVMSHMCALFLPPIFNQKKENSPVEQCGLTI